MHFRTFNDNKSFALANSRRGSCIHPSSHYWAKTESTVQFHGLAMNKLDVCYYNGNLEGYDEPIAYLSHILDGVRHARDATHDEYRADLWAVVLLGQYLESLLLKIPAYHNSAKWILNLSYTPSQLPCRLPRLTKFVFTSLAVQEWTVEKLTHYCSWSLM